MLYHVFYPLKIFLSAFNIFSYITFRALCAMATALFLSFVIGPSIISYLKKLQYVQIIRSDGPQTHLAKSGTPTMGGILILISVIVSTLLWARLDNRFILWIIFGVLWLGMLGFIDDYLKIARKNPKGLNKTWKLIGQSLFALGVCLYLFYFPLVHRRAIPLAFARTEIGKPQTLLVTPNAPNLPAPIPQIRNIPDQYFLKCKLCKFPGH